MAWPLVFIAATAAMATAQARYDAEAIRLNNRGVALMGQQFTERAADAFAQAFRKDPKLVQAEDQRGHRAADAAESSTKPRRRSGRPWLSTPTSAQAWYNLGLAQHAGNELDQALTSFEQAVKFDPGDADSWYFEGACYQEMQQFDKAIATFKKALAVNPLHASAEFALARSLQRTGHTAEAREHFARFQHLTSTKISSAIGLSYGEQGRYSTATPVEEPETIQRAMIPVRLVAQPMVPVDFETWRRIHHHGRRVHDGCDRLGEHGSGADAIGRAGDSRTAQSWRRKL